MTKLLLKAVVYSRNSSAKQKSINAQERENLDHAARHGWGVIAKLSDPSSASPYSTKIRKNWQTVEDLLPAMDVLVLWEQSRGSRDAESWLRFLRLCKENAVVIYVTSHGRSYDPRNTFDWKALAEQAIDSEHESNKTSERVSRDRVAEAESGAPHSRPPYGYKRWFDRETGKFSAQEEHPEHAAVVRDIFARVAAGEPVRSIATRLTRTGVPTARSAAVWISSSIIPMLRNPAYRPHPDSPDRGCRVYNGSTYAGQWPPLVDEVTWQRVQAVLGREDEATRKLRKAAPPGAVKYLLSGNANVMTAPCGSTLAGFMRKGVGTYACNACRCASSPMVEADEYVSDLVVERLSRKDERDLWVEDDSGVRKASGELKRLRADLQRARESYAAIDGISEEALAMKERVLLPAIADAERRARPQGTPLGVLALLDAAEIGAGAVRPAWEALTLTTKREVISRVFSVLVLEPATQRLTRHTSKAERLEIVSDRIRHTFR